MTTRRTMFKIIGAAALPMGFRAPALKVLAADNAVEVLDDDPTREPTFEGTGYWFGAGVSPYSKLTPRYIYARGYADGTGELIFQDDREDGGDRPDPRYELGTMRFDAAQFALLCRLGFAPLD